MQLSSFWLTEEEGFFEVSFEGFFDGLLELDVPFEDDLEEVDFDPVDLLGEELVLLEFIAADLLELAADDELESFFLESS